MSTRKIVIPKRPLAKSDATHPARQTKRNDRLIEMAAEQLAILLWKTWLHKKNAEDKEDKMKNHPKRLSTAF